MKKVWKETINKIINNKQILVLFIIPLLTVNILTFNFELKELLSQIFSFILTISLFVLFLRPTDFYLLKTPSFVFRYILVDIAIGAISLMLIFALTFLINSDIPENYITMYVFIALFLSAPLNIFLPMTVMDDDLSITNFINLTKVSLLNWLTISLIVYLPFPLFDHFIENNLLTTLTEAIRIVVFCSFNASFYQARKKKLQQVTS